CRAAVDPAGLLPGRADRPGQPLGRLPLHRAAEDEGRPADRHPAALHGQLHDLYRALRRHRRRPRQLDHFPLHRPGEDGGRAVRPRPRRGLQPDVFPGDPAGLLGVLHRDDEPRPGECAMKLRPSAFVMAAYLIFLMVPIYWLLNMSLKTNTEITSTFTLWPQTFTLRNYAVILTDPSWYMGYVNSIIYVVLNTVISITVALPAAYAFSR